MCIMPDPGRYIGPYLAKLTRVEELKLKYQSEGLDPYNAYLRANSEVFHPQHQPQGHGIPDVPRNSGNPESHT